jgi:hypothetical protein
MAEYGLYLLAAWAGGSALMGNRSSTTQETKPDDNNNTSVVPMYFNSVELGNSAGGLAGEERFSNHSYDKTLVSKVINMLSSATQSKIRQQMNTASINGSGSSFGITMDQPAPTQTSNNPLDQIGGSLIPGSNDFTHGNMVPFQKGSFTQDTRAENRAKEGKLELYTGQPKFHQQKQERGMLFHPSENHTKLHGTPVDGQHRDLSRYNPNNTGKKHGEAPCEKVQVGPGLAQGYTAAPSGGFHQDLRILPKDITGLRIDPVVESEGRIKSGGSHIGARTLNPQVYRNRQQLLVENKNGERNFTTVGAVTGRTLRPQVVLRHTNRKKSRQIIGGAKSDGYHKHRLTPKTKQSTRKNLKHTVFRNAGSHVSTKVNDYSRGSYRVKPNNRQTTGLKTHLTGTSGHKRHTNYLRDKARKTRKMIKSARPYGNVGTDVTKGISYNPDEWVARTTIKETTADNSHIGFQGQTAGSNLPSYDPVNWAARTTVRQTTEDNDHIGWTGPSELGKNQTYNLDPARVTVRQTTENNDHVGWTGPSEIAKIQTYNLDPARVTIRQTMGYDGRNHSIATSDVKKHAAWNTNDKARTTIRQTMGYDGLHHSVATSGIKKHIAWNTKDKARKTIRETTEQTNHYGGSSAIHKKSIAWNTKERARTTVKETTEDNKRIGNVEAGEHRGGGYSTSKWDAKNTNRQFTSDHEYTGTAMSHRKKTTSRENAYNARTNENKEVIAQGRAPGSRGPTLGHQDINVEFKKLEDDRVNKYARVKQTTVGNTFNPNVNLTTQRNYLPQEHERLDSTLLDAFRRNPLTQSLHSY